MPRYDYLIVGAGFAGAVLAERLASQSNRRCLVVDRRAHIAGNAYDFTDRAGVLLHRYGPHYFRTNSGRIREYLSQFTEWRPVDYKILSWSDGRYWQFPINLNTFEQFIGRASSSEEMADTLAKWRVPPPDGQPRNSEEKIVSQVGPALYEKFFRHYTRKQWHREPRDLDPSVCGRIPIRTNRDDRYLSESFQAMPRDGYTPMFERMLRHPNIEVRLQTDYREARAAVEYDHLIYTGPLDEFFDHCHGPLPYRSLRFEPETIEQEFYQPVVQVNYPNEHDFTRIVEIKHATGQTLPVTTIVREYPEDYLPGREAYYPLPAPDAQALYKKYEAMADAEPRTSFVGRMATYRYYNMDQVVGMALAEFDRLHGERASPSEVTTAPEVAAPELLVVMPVYNEQAAVGKAVAEWFTELERWTPDFRFLIINDGSTDGTLAVLRELHGRLGARLEIVDRENRGHGQSCLQGYRIARERGVPFVFQIDSDGQCDPQFFGPVWRARDTHDVVYGHRTRRDDGWQRVVVSAVERVFLLVLFRVNCVDANVPYRLMRTASLGPALARIPATFGLSNVALSVLLRKNGTIREGRVPIHFRARSGGEPMVRLGGFAPKAVELYRQLQRMLSEGN